MSPTGPATNPTDTDIARTTPDPARDVCTEYTCIRPHAITPGDYPERYHPDNVDIIPPYRSRPPTTYEESLTETLARLAERENDLLNQASAAHSAGWRTALLEACALLDHHASTADPVAQPGLTAAVRILAALAGDPPPPTAHRLDAAIVPNLDSPEYRVHCTAPAGAPCRVTCPCKVRAPRPGLECADWCPRDLVDADRCLAADVLERELFDAYAGPSRPITSGPIAVRYTTDGPEWIYAADLDVTPDQWAAAAETPRP